MLNTEVVLLFLPSRVMVVHRPSPCESNPLLMMADAIFCNAIIVVPPALQLLFHESTES